MVFGSRENMSERGGGFVRGEEKGTDRFDIRGYKRQEKQSER